MLSFSRTSLNDWEDVVRRLPSGSAYQGGDVLPGAAELLASLSESERAELYKHYILKLKALEKQFPHLKHEFPEQFR